MLAAVVVDNMHHRRGAIIVAFIGEQVTICTVVVVRVELRGESVVTKKSYPPRSIMIITPIIICAVVMQGDSQNFSPHCFSIPHRLLLFFCLSVVVVGVAVVTVVVAAACCLKTDCDQLI